MAFTPSPRGTAEFTLVNSYWTPSSRATADFHLSGSGFIPSGRAVKSFSIEPPTSNIYVRVDGEWKAASAFIRDDGQWHLVEGYITGHLRGFNNIQEMLSVHGFTWGHRGNSIQWPELSMLAFDETAKRGYGVLEISFGRTADGVWFGLHDETLNRTSGTVGLPPVLQMTWADVQQYQNQLGIEGAPQPYVRWEDIRDKYAKSHVLVMDPKHAVLSHAPARAEFVSMMNEVGTDRAIFKFSGDAVWLADIYSNAGFHTWGYFYESNFATGLMDQRQDAWSILGMEYIASQEAWDAAKSYGKPVVGHIAPTQEAYDTAMAKGADGVQCSGTHVIDPVSWWT